MAIKQNRIIGQGETLSFNLVYKGSNLYPIDLTGHSITLTIYRNSTVVGTYAGSTDAQGNIEIVVPNETTALWKAGKHNYLIEHGQPDGLNEWILRGTLTVVSVMDA